MRLQTELKSDIEFHQRHSSHLATVSELHENWTLSKETRPNQSDIHKSKAQAYILTDHWCLWIIYVQLNHSRWFVETARRTSPL